MSIASWCIRNNRTSLVLFMVVALAGIATFFSIEKRENPDFTVRNAIVITNFPGAAPKRVEELVTDKLEEQLREMPEIKNITSQSMTGVSIINVEIQARYKDMTPVWAKLRNKVDDAKPNLPAEALTPQINDEYGDVFGILVAITGDGYTYRELKDAADIARNQLLRVKNMGKVERWGVQEERVFVELDNAGFKEYGFSPFLLGQIIKQQNTLQPSGSALVGSERIVIEPTGQFETVEDIANITMRPPGQESAVVLKDYANVWRGFVDPPTKMVHYNGKPCILLALSMAEGGNVIDLGAEVQHTLQKIRDRMPLGLEFNLLAFQSEHVEAKINDFMVNLAESFGFVFIIMLLFAGWRIGLIASSLVPMAMLACLAIMPFVGVKLQQISIASLIISLGILVDNGVVVSESVLVRLAAGQDRDSAVNDAVKELWMPLLAASLTTIFAFLPIPLAQSSTGEYCFSLFVVVSITLLCSWVLSLTMVPMLCHVLLKPKVEVQTFSSIAYRIYRWILMRCLKNRIIFLILVVGMCYAAVWGFQFVPKMFFPPNERPQFLIDFWQPYGTDIEVTRDRVRKLEDFLLAQNETESVGGFIGTGGPRWYLPLSIEEDNKNYAFLLVNTKELEGVDPLLERTREHLAEHFPDCRPILQKLLNGPPVGAPIQIRLSGDDIDTLYELKDRIDDVLRETEGVNTIWNDWGQWTKKLVVDVDQQKAKRAGLSSYDIATSLQLQMAGISTTDFREGDTSIPVVVRTRDAFRADLGRIEGLNVYSTDTTNSAPLLQVADARLEWQPSNIRRRDQVRTMTIKADVKGRFSSAVLADIIPKVNKLMEQPDWPIGYHVEYGGESEKSQEANESIAANMPLSMMLLILVLVSQFNSLRRPLVILLTIPPMICGITVGMLATNAPFGFMATLGMISLIGIIVNNAIMLIDQIELLRADGMDTAHAIVMSAMKRSRPIIMTTVTTIIGMIPLSLQGGEMWRPMANCIISGLAFATVLTLALCPVLYSMFFRAGFRNYVWKTPGDEAGAE